jgi:hypothetical protein
VAALHGATSQGAQPARVAHFGDAPIGLREPPRSIAGVSLDRAIEQAERRYHARVVRANTVEADGRMVHVLRLLSEKGRVWTIRIDAASGGEL